MIKNEGNQLHNSGQYEEAAAKYLLAKTNLEGDVSPQAKNIVKSCSLNLAMCYLKTKNYASVIEHASSVIDSGDSGNLKALYRRGMAYKVGNLSRLSLCFNSSLILLHHHPLASSSSSFSLVFALSMLPFSCAIVSSRVQG